ncbi:MAG: ATP-binding cassette domain-containing protein [Planctomycetaceae bacterium]|nr:ATP-binding cassette domain-containing protein [Planctomycetaceae bacterium]
MFANKTNKSKTSVKKSKDGNSDTSSNSSDTSWLSVIGANEHNLKGINVSFPISAFSVVTGVSGSGKSSLVHDIIGKSLSKVLNRNFSEKPSNVKSITGIEHLNKVINVTQHPIGQTPTSNPATYTGIFDLIRELFSKLPDARLRGYTARRFSFNTPDGRCEKCEGAGQIKIEMHFLPDVWITCDACNGKRYDRQTLEIKYRGYTIADILEMTCSEALNLFNDIPRIRRTLQLLCDVGLGYLALGQPAPTLSGGESQRIKLTAELTRPDTGRTLYLLDEPTTGLHFEDMNKLLHVIHRLVDLGNTVIVIEHNLDIIKNADWIVDLGPDAGDNGGYLMFEGTPEELVKSKAGSHTAAALAPVLKKGHYEIRTPFTESIDNNQTDDLTSLNIEIDKMPWEKDGEKWHTEEHIGRNGNTVKWDGQILKEIVNRIEAAEQFTPTNWNHKSIVEIYSDKKSIGWFMHAITSDEWVLKITFRTGGGTFKRESLMNALALKPFAEIDGIPIYNAEPRVKLRRQTIQWQEIELQLHSFDEINHPQFYEFLNTAIREFIRFKKGSPKATTKSSSLNSSASQSQPQSQPQSQSQTLQSPQSPIKETESLMPWRVLGEKWHYIQRGLIGGDKLLWNLSLLTEIFGVLREIIPDVQIEWTNKSFVQFFYENRKSRLSDKVTVDLQKSIWAVVWTKQVEAIKFDLYVKKNSITSKRLKNIGFDQHEIIAYEEYDIVKLQFKKESDLKKSELQQLLKETL